MRSAGSEHALDALISLFDLEDTEITLPHVIETPWLLENREEEELSAADMAFQQVDQVKAGVRREADELPVDARLGTPHGCHKHYPRGSPGR
jgi:hypothetical protein